MTNLAQMLLGVALVGVGLVLALGFPDLEFFIFSGRPLGVVLAVLGVLDLAEGAFKRR